MVDHRILEPTTPSLKWYVEHPLSAKGVSGKVQAWLYKQPPCNIVKLSDAYELDVNQAAVRAAVYQHVANTPVFRGRNTSIAYGLRIVIGDTEIIIALPGLRVEWIALDYDKDYRKAVKAKLDDHVGPDARKLLFESLQKRSVDLISKEMNATRSRHNGRCKICLTMEEDESSKVTSCHLIKRVTVFWVIIDTIIHKQLDPLSEEALCILKQAIRTNPYHSREEYMIPLCRKHDNAVRDALQNVSQGLENADPEKCFFDIK